MLKAIIATLALATTSTVAMADSPYDYDHQRPTYSDRDGRFNTSNGHPILEHDVLLSSQGQPVFVQLDRRSNINRIRIERREGRVVMTRIDAVFADGRRANLLFNRDLSRQHPVVAVDLPRGATGLIIESAPLRQGRGAGWSRWRGAMSARVDLVGVHVNRWRR